MVKQLRGIVIASAVLCLPLVSAGVAAGQAPRASYTDLFTTKVPGVSAGRSFTADWVNPESPSQKAHGISHILVVLHPGARFDTTAVARCTASDPELIALGEAACPPGSKVGTDVLVGDTGFPEPGRYATLNSVLLNGDGQVIFLAQEAQTGVRVVVRGKASGNTLDIPIPFIPGTPPEGAAPVRERGTWLERTGPGGKGFFTTPPVCSDDNRWRNQVTYSYRDGVVQTAMSTTPCVRGKNQGRIRCRGEAATLAGSPDADLIRGTAGRDVIAARGGNDRIRAGAGDDVVCGGKGSDRANGGSGDDWIRGGPGRDRLIGGRGDDHCRGSRDRKTSC
jgi:Ca2+-binding RTX toxin-like protein